MIPGPAIQGVSGNILYLLLGLPIFVIKSLKDMHMLFSKQHILNFPGKMGCSILCACVGEKIFVHLQVVLGKYCQFGLKIKIALHPIPSLLYSSHC